MTQNQGESMKIETEPFLKGKLVYLRALERSDLTERYLAWLNDPDVNEHLFVGRSPSTTGRRVCFLGRAAGTGGSLAHLANADSIAAGRYAEFRYRQGDFAVYELTGS